MSPVRNASKALADVMQRSEQRGAESERRRLLRLAQAWHERAGHAESPFASCPDGACVALREVLSGDRR